MQTVVSNPAIIRFLKNKFKGAGFVDGLKIKYRSLICPFISLVQMVRPGEKVGDVGCGSGQFLLLLSEFSAASYLYGIEINHTLVKNATNLFQDMPPALYQFDTYDGQTFPVKLRDMDVIFLIDVLHHVPKQMQTAFLKHLVEIMKPGARLILKDINAASPLVYFNKLHDLIFAREIGNEMTMHSAATYLTDYGLTITKQDNRTMYVYPHYTIVAQKQ